MKELLQVVVLGSVAGVIYALFAIGVSVLYRGTKTINFALGEVGTFALFVFWYLSTDRGLPMLFGLVAALGVGILLTVGFERTVIARMVSADRTSVAVATIGLLTLLLSVEFRFFGGSPRRLPAPVTGDGVGVLDIVLVPSVLVSLVVVVAFGVGITVLLRRTDFGLGVLAAAQDPDATRLVGVPLARVSMFVWGIGGVLAVSSAWLDVSSRAGIFVPGSATELYIKGLVGAVLGGLDSVRGAIAGAFAVGLIEAAATKYLSFIDIPNVTLVLLFAAVIAVLLVRPTGLFAATRTRGAT
jgi:branched-chain amino acid transport system permease protein